MTVTVATSDWLVPNKWRTTLQPRVAKLSIPELEEALSVVKTVLEGRSDAEIQSLACVLVQSVAPTSGTEPKGVPLVFVFEPRMIYQLYSSGMTRCTQQALPLIENLAIGTLIAVNRACMAMDQANSIGASPNVYTAVSSARAFGEWLYFLSSLKSNADALEHLFPRQVRTAAKKKISKKASDKSKAYWDKKLAPEKQKVIDAYEAGKPWDNVKKAAIKIWGDAITKAVDFDKLYKWLLAHAKGKPF